MKVHTLVNVRRICLFSGLLTLLLLTVSRHLALASGFLGSLGSFGCLRLRWRLGGGGSRSFSGSGSGLSKSYQLIYAYTSLVSRTHTLGAITLSNLMSLISGSC